LAGLGVTAEGFAGEAPSGLETREAGGFPTRGGRGNPPTACASVERAGFGVG